MQEATEHNISFARRTSLTPELDARTRAANLTRLGYGTDTEYVVMQRWLTGPQFAERGCLCRDGPLRSKHAVSPFRPHLLLSRPERIQARSTEQTVEQAQADFFELVSLAGVDPAPRARGTPHNTRQPSPPPDLFSPPAAGDSSRSRRLWPASPLCPLSQGESPASICALQPRTNACANSRHQPRVQLGLRWVQRVLGLAGQALGRGTLQAADEMLPKRPAFEPRHRFQTKRG